MTCAHMNFEAACAVARIEDTGRFDIEVKVRCSDCGTQFQFLGLEPGYNPNGANVSIDGEAARLAILPRGAVPNPLQRMVHGKTRFDS